MQRGGCIKWDSAGVILVIAVVSLFIRAQNMTLQERIERLSMMESAGILFEIAIFLIGTTEKANILSYHFFLINQSSVHSRKISCTWTAAEKQDLELQQEKKSSQQLLTCEIEWTWSLFTGSYE